MRQLGEIFPTIRINVVKYISTNRSEFGRVTNAYNYTHWNERACLILAREGHGPAWKGQHMVLLLRRA